MTVKMKLYKEKKTDAMGEQQRVQIFAQQMLTTKVFAGTYRGRFYVENLKAYRDVVQLCKGEKEFAADLEEVNNRINNFYRGAFWSAITGPDYVGLPAAGNCMWVSLQNVPFGDYWFTIKDVTFSQGGEVVITIKVIRKFEPDLNSMNTIQQEDQSQKWEDIQKGIATSLREIFTWNNLKETARFLFLLSMTIVTALLYGLQYLGEYSLRFFREFNNFIKVCTPIFLAMLDMVTKAIGGFYILIAMLWGGRGRVPGQGPPPYLSLKAPPPRHFRPIKQQWSPPKY